MGRSPGARCALRRAAAAAVLTVATVASGLVATTTPASAAGPWFVAPTGLNSAGCGLAAETPCLTVTFVLAKPAFVSGDVINVAAGTYVDRPLFGAKTADVRGASAATTIFDGSNTGFAMGVLIPAAQTLTLSQLTLRNGRSNAGGGLAVGTGSVVANGVVLSGNTSPQGGGAYVGTGASLTMNGGAITGNTSVATVTGTGAGGGAFVAGRVGAGQPGRLTLTDVSVSGNLAHGVTAVSGGNGGGVFNAGTTSVVRGSFTGNQTVAASNGTTARRGQGGSLYNGGQDADDEPRLTMSGTTVTGGLGAGAFNASSGGGIANGDRWGIAAPPVTTPTLVATDVTLTGNTAIYGGGIYNGGTATVTGGSLATNGAGAGGGAYQNPLVFPGTPAVATFDGTSFTGNVANGVAWSFNSPNFGNGGAIFNQTALTVRNARFVGNRAVPSTSTSKVTGWGGAIFSGPFAANDAPALTISDTTIDGGGASGGNAVVGGGIASPNNVLDLAGATAGAVDATRLALSNNVALAAGGLLTGGIATLTDSTVHQNDATHASGGFGGGIYALKSPVTGSPNVVTLDHTQVTDNSAGAVGGGIAGLAGSTIALRDASVISGNDAVTGGGLFNGGAVTVTGSSITGNRASFQGGGAYNGSATVADTPTMTMTDVQVTGNTAPTGGGIATIARATLTLAGGAVSDNEAVGGGGLFVNDNGAASIDGTDLVRNTATASGGGAILNSGTLTVRRALLDGNRSIHTTGNATGLGGAIYSGTSSTDVTTKLTVDASTISHNHAWAGSALVTFSPGARSTNEASIDRSTIHGNTSETVFGAIEQVHPLSITNSTITANTAVGAAGALSLLAPGTVRVAGTILSDNGGASCSAPITAANDGGYNLVDAGDGSCGFSAARNDRSGVAQLGALGANGGDTPTRVPGPASRALDAIPAGTATTITDAVTGVAVVLCNGPSDQRGVARPQGAKCDIGSVEATQVAPTVTGPTSAIYTVGSPGPSVTFTTTGSPTPHLSASGTLPPGVTFVDNGDGTGTLGGAPTSGTFGTYPITITATNEAGQGTHLFTLDLRRGVTTLEPAALLLDLPNLDLNSPMVLSAKLTGGSPAQPLAGQTIVFKVGATTVCTSVTAADGGTVCTMTLLNTVTATLNGSVTATYAGSPAWEPSSATAPLIAF